MENIKQEIENIDILKKKLKTQIIVYENKQKELRYKLFKLCNHQFVKEDCLYGEKYCTYCNLPPNYCNNKNEY